MLRLISISFSFTISLAFHQIQSILKTFNSSNRAILDISIESNIRSGLIMIVSFHLFMNSIRKKRALSNRMLLTLRANYPTTCRTTACQQQFLADILQQCSNHSNMTLRLQSALTADQTAQFDLKFINFTLVGKSEMEIRKLTIAIRL